MLDCALWTVLYVTFAVSLARYSVCGIPVWIDTMHASDFNVVAAEVLFYFLKGD